MKTTLCVAVILLTLAVLLQFTGDNLAEAGRGSRSSRSRSGSSRRRGSSYSSRRRSGGGSYSGGAGMSGTVKIILIIVGSIFGVVLLVMLMRCLCRTEETRVVTVSQNPVAQAPDPQVQQGYNDPQTWSNKQDVPAYPVAYTNGQMPPDLPPVYSAAMETSFTAASEDPGRNGPPSNPYSAAAVSYPPPNVTEPTPTETAGNVEVREPASNPYSNAGITWQSPDVIPPAAAPPPSYGDVYNS